jgi:hypothetical protein
MAKVNVGVVGQAQLNAGMGALNSGETGTSSPVAWSAIWFGMAVFFILAVYFGFGGLRGSVAS